MEWTSWLEGAGAATGASAGVLAYAVRVPSCTLLAPSVHRGVKTRPAIALTFDDGPSESSSSLLEILARHNAPATFFQCGANIRRLPQVAREIAAAGHEIGNHSDSHARLYLRSQAYIYDELARAQETIEATTGLPSRLFRPPYGARWFGLREAQQRLRLLGVMWTALALDWKWPKERVLRRLLDGCRNGAILCLHDGRGLEPHPDIRATLGVVAELLPKLIEKGFHFEKVTDILCPTKI